MGSNLDHIYPVFEKMLPREAKEELLGQRGAVIWMYGLSGSGKSTLANLLERRLHEQGKMVKVLDGDNVRSGLNSNLGFSDEDRLEILDDEEVAKQAVWLIDGYEPTPAAVGVFAAAQAKTIPYPMLPYMGLLHTALGNELADFMQGKESAEQALKDVEAAYVAAAKEKGFL